MTILAIGITAVNSAFLANSTILPCLADYRIESVVRLSSIRPKRRGQRHNRFAISIKDKITNTAIVCSVSLAKGVGQRITANNLTIESYELYDANGALVDQVYLMGDFLNEYLEVESTVNFIESLPIIEAIQQHITGQACFAA